jgi:hypothetical protein
MMNTKQQRYNFGSRVLALGVAIVALALSTPGRAMACGIPFAARIPAEQALITFANGREEIITSVRLQSDGAGAAVVFPVPGAPEVTALPDNDLFAYLEEVTRPEIRTEQVVVDPNAPPAAGAGAPEGVNVLGRELIGGYDVARLQADDASALDGWLGQNGYSLPPGAEPILKAYIDEDWSFVAVRLAGDRAVDGALAPLRLAFDAREIVYPMRLGALADRPLDVLLYVLADHRVELSNMTAEYAGTVAALARRPPASLADIFRAPYLTKLRNRGLDPATLSADFVARQAASDEPYRMVETRTVFVAGTPPPAGRPRRGLAGAVFGLVLAFIASMVALGFAFGLRRRIDKIAGPPPDEDDD